MVEIRFAPSFQKHQSIAASQVESCVLRDALNDVFGDHPRLRSYVLDDQGGVRKHVTIFINDETIEDRENLTDTLKPGDRVFVFQALSGG